MRTPASAQPHRGRRYLLGVVGVGLGLIPALVFASSSGAYTCPYTCYTCYGHCAGPNDAMISSGRLFGAGIVLYIVLLLTAVSSLFNVERRWVGYSPLTMVFINRVTGVFGCQMIVNTECIEG